jgi:hypothetical protein
MHVFIETVSFFCFLFFLSTNNFIALLAVNNSLGIQFCLVSLVVSH